MRTPLLLTCCLVMVSCGQDERMEAALADEARWMGWYVGTAERCGPDVRHPLGIPSRYDDSLEEGRLASAFQDGYRRGVHEETPCVSGVPGR